MADKKEFKWDSEQLISTIEISDYEKKEVKVCTLKAKEYITFTTIKKIKDAWKPVAGYSIPKAQWSTIVEAVGDHSISSAFTETATTKVKIKATEEPKKKVLKGGKKK